MMKIIRRHIVDVMEYNRAIQKAYVDKMVSNTILRKIWDEVEKRLGGINAHMVDV